MVYLNTFKTRREAALAVFQYIEGFYNRRRRHESLNRITPYEFRRKWIASQVRAGVARPADMEYGVKGKSAAALDTVRHV